MWAEPCEQKLRDAIPPYLCIRADKHDEYTRELADNDLAAILRQILRGLGFSDDRQLRLGLDHKYRQSQLFAWHCPGVYPRTLLVPRSESPTPFVDQLMQQFPRGYFVKPATGSSSGDNGSSDWTEKLATILAGEFPVTDFVAQERIAIVQEYRVHTCEDCVIPGLTSFRYVRAPISEHLSFVVEEFVAKLLSALPSVVKCDSLIGWDIAEDAAGQLWVVECNFTGIYGPPRPGFQTSGFFQDREFGPAHLAQFANYVQSRYRTHVRFDLSGAEQSTSSAHYRRTSEILSDIVSDNRSSYDLRLTSPREYYEITVIVESNPALSDDALTRSSLGLLEKPWLTVPLVATLDRRQEFPETEDLEGPKATIEAMYQRELIALDSVNTEFLLWLPSGTICLRPPRLTELFRCDRSYVHRYHGGPTRRQQLAASILQLPEAKWTYDYAPALLSSAVLRNVLHRLLRVYGQTELPADVASSIDRVALPFLYFTYLEAMNQFSVWHCTSLYSVTGNCFWKGQAWEDWLPSECFKSDWLFTIVEGRRCHEVQTLLRMNKLLDERVPERFAP
jgi:hypothetical protein